MCVCVRVGGCRYASWPACKMFMCACVFDGVHVCELSPHGAAAPSYWIHKWVCVRVCVGVHTEWTHK